MKKEQISPPGLFLSFFRWFCQPRLLDYIEGDLLEVYDRRYKEFGKRKADWKFIVDVVLLFRPGIIKSRKGYQKFNTNGMYKSYFKIKILHNTIFCKITCNNRSTLKSSLN